MQEPARQHTPLTFNRGFVHDCVSLLVRRAYTARSIDRIKEPPFLLNAEMCVNTIVYWENIFLAKQNFFLQKCFPILPLSRGVQNCSQLFFSVRGSKVVPFSLDKKKQKGFV